MTNKGDYKLDGETTLGFDGAGWVSISGAVVSKDDSEMQVIVRVGTDAEVAPTGVLELPGLPGYTGFVSVTGVGGAESPAFPDASSDA